MRSITFKNFYAPGDCLVSTSAIRDLHLSYPFKFQIAMYSCYPEVFYNNPNINGNGNFYKEFIELNPFEWKLKNQDNGFHYSDAFYFLLENILSVKIEKTSIFPEIFLTLEEKSEQILDRLKIK